MIASISSTSLFSGTSTTTPEGIPLIAGEKQQQKKGGAESTTSTTSNQSTKKRVFGTKKKPIMMGWIEKLFRKRTKEFASRVDMAATEGLSEEIYQMASMKPFKRIIPFQIIYYILAILTLGIIPLICLWIPTLYIIMTHLRIKNIKKATAMLIHENRGGKSTIVYVKKKRINGKLYQYFKYRHCKYIFDEEEGEYRRAKQATLFDKSFTEMHQRYGRGLDEEAQLLHKFMYGINSCTIPKPNIIKLFFTEVLNPFYFFQIFCMIVWLLDDYYFYAATILFISIVSALTALIDTVKNKQRLRKMTRFETTIKRYRMEEKEEISSNQLVPGDLIDIPREGILPCDIMLLTGQVIMNESMLTGESIPVVKKAAPINSTEYFQYGTHGNYILYGGTEVMQKRSLGQQEGVRGVVIRSGYQCAKGELILSILYPKPNQFKFYRDSLIYIALMLGFGAIAFAGTIQFFIANKSSVEEIILRAADIFTIILPPSLPIAMTVGVSHAIYRLRKLKIFCISPPRINVSGRIDTMCFDKTGTLTENGLQLDCVLDGSTITEVPAEEVSATLEDSELLKCLACCHSLTYVNNELIGDPLEVSIFEATKYKLVDPNEDDVGTVAECTIIPPSKSTTHGEVNTSLYEDGDELMDMQEYGILRRFEFQSALQMMSVVVRDITKPSSLFVYCKGSPEKILSLCTEETMSDAHRADIQEKLTYYTQNGFRVLGCAYRQSDFVKFHQLNKMNRRQFETNLIFLGFVILQNPIKPETSPIIEVLFKNKISSVMVTGDNALTALSVSRDCGIVRQNEQIYISHLVKRSMSYTFDDESIPSDAASLSLTFKNPFEPNEDHIPFEDLLDIQFKDRRVFVVNGDSFEYILNTYHEDDIKNFMLSCRVFARCTPFQKMQLIELLQHYNLSVGMCGDGANDCMALKSAHIGVSLTKAEASIAAPFTSLVETIECVPMVIREGRAALATSFSTFKYMAMYSIIQTVTVILLYYVNSNLSDLEFLFIDMGIIFPLVMAMGIRGSAKKLTKYRPEDTLLSLRVFLSMFLQMLIAIALQGYVFWEVSQQPWFVPAHGDTNKHRLKSHRSTILFLISAFQTFFMSQSFSISFPFRRSLIVQPIYVITSIILFMGITYLCLYPCSFLTYWFEFGENIPIQYRLRILGYGVAFGVVSYLMEAIVIVYVMRYPVPNKKKLYRKKLRRLL